MTAVAKRAVFWLGLVAAITAFAIAHGLSEYRIARSARTYMVVDGVERDLTPEELVSSFLIGNTIQAVPIGAVAVGLLCWPLTFAARRFRSFPGISAYLVGIGVGTVVGGFLSFFVWVLLGGWGPPLLLPSVAAGAVLAPALVAASRGQQSPNLALRQTGHANKVSS
jgi:hypothetical protein